MISIEAGFRLLRWTIKFMRSIPGTGHFCTAACAAALALPWSAAEPVSVNFEVPRGAASCTSPDRWTRRLPLAPQFSLHYAESENFMPSAVRHTIFGASIPPPVGETQEYGLSVSMLEGKFRARFNWYDTASKNASAGFNWGYLFQGPASVFGRRFKADSFLRGFYIGGAYRWEDEAGIGYPVIVKATESGTRETIDVQNPHFGPVNGRVDAWIGYQRRILSDCVDWKLQLNIRNLLNENALIPAFAQPDGSVATYRIPTPLKWYLTSTLSF